MKTNLRTILAKWCIGLALFAVVFPNRVKARPGDPPPPTLQQLKDEMAQMELMMNHLKGQIAVLEAASSGSSASSASYTTVSAVSAAPAAAMPIAERSETPESGRSISVYGFAMLDSGYDFKTNNPDWFDVVRPTKLPAFAGEFAPDGKVYYGVRQTRFGVKSSTPTSLGDLKTIFEFELFGTGVDAGQTTFRLRHAWGELGKFGAGQTWSPFMDPDVFPNSLEYWGPSGMVFFRNLQFRWTPIQKGDSRLAFAVERPGASADQGVYSDRISELGLNLQSKFDMPDFSVQGHLARSWGYVQVAGMFRKISWVQTNATPALNISGDVFGWGVNTSSNIKLGAKNTARLQVVYGEGIENYMNDAPIDVGPRPNPSNPARPVLGVPLPVLGTVSFLDHNWNDKFSSSVGYSFVNIWNTNAELPADFHQGHYALGNLLYYPAKNVMMGGEFQFGRRVNRADGFNVNDYRVQFSFKYNFGRDFTY